MSASRSMNKGCGRAADTRDTRAAIATILMSFILREFHLEHRIDREIMRSVTFNILSSESFENPSTRNRVFLKNME